MKFSPASFLILPFVFVGPPVIAQSAVDAKPVAVQACTEMDFLAGNWDVYRADGTKDAEVQVTPGPGHCYQSQLWHFTKAFGEGQGFCLAAYSNAKHNWATLCSLWNGDRYVSSKGELVGSELRFVGEDLSEGVTQTSTFSKLPDGRIHELVTETSDGGKTTKVLADEYLSKRPSHGRSLVHE